jgi:hypothetical protein
VLADGSVGDAERLGDVVVGLPERDQPQRLRLALGQPGREQRLEQRHRRSRHVQPEPGRLVGDRVQVGLDQERPRAVGEIALGIAVVRLAAAERDRQHASRARRQGERHLVLDAHRRIHLAVQRKAVQALSRADVGEAHRAPVERALVVLQDRVLVGVADPCLEQLRAGVRRHQRDHVERARADVVQRDEVRRQRPVQRVEQAMAQLVDVQQPADVADQLEQARIRGAGQTVLGHTSAKRIPQKGDVPSPGRPPRSSADRRARRAHRLPPWTS